MEATDASRLVCVVVVSNIKNTHSHIITIRMHHVPQRWVASLPAALALVPTPSKVRRTFAPSHGCPALNHLTLAMSKLQNIDVT